MKFQESMAIQAKKLKEYIAKGGVNALPTRIRGSNGADPSSPPHRVDAPFDNHSSELEVLMTDVAKAILLVEK